MTICLAGSDQISSKTYTYENVQKADPQTGKCSELFVPCSEYTSALNTICVQPFERPLLCPITDVRIVAKDKVDEFLPGYATYSQVDPPADTNAGWVLFYSKDFDSPPIRDFQFEPAPTCNGKRIGNPEQEMLELSVKKEIYQSWEESQSCLDADTFLNKQRMTFKLASTQFTYSEYDFLE